MLAAPGQRGVEVRRPGLGVHRGDEQRGRGVGVHRRGLAVGPGAQGGPQAALHQHGAEFGRGVFRDRPAPVARVTLFGRDSPAFGLPEFDHHRDQGPLGPAMDPHDLARPRRREDHPWVLAVLEQRLAANHTFADAGAEARTHPHVVVGDDGHTGDGRPWGHQPSRDAAQGQVEASSDPVSPGDAGGCRTRRFLTAQRENWTPARPATMGGTLVVASIRSPRSGYHAV